MVILIDTKILFNQTQTLKKNDWIYLGNNYAVKNKLNKILGEGQYVDIYKDFIEIQKSLKQHFINFIDKLSSENDSLKWWVSSLHEKNVAIEKPLFLRLCYLKYVLNLERKTKTFYVISDDLILLKTLSKNIKEVKKIFFVRNRFFQNLKKYYKMRRRFFLKYFFSKFFNKTPKIKKKCTAILTWIDERNFSKTKFQENYFGKFYEYISQKENFLLLPFYLYTLDRVKAEEYLKKEQVQYLNLFDNYKRIDVLKSLFFTFFDNNIFLKRYEFCDLDISVLVKESFLEDLLGNRAAEYYLKFYSIKRTVKKIVNLEKLIYPFENQPWEKVLCYAFKKYSPTTKLCGYMHTLSLKYLLSMFPGKYEKKYMPQPDKIFTTGKITADELKTYFQKNIVEENSAYRYEYLFNKKSENFLIGEFSKSRDNELSDNKIIELTEETGKNEYKILVALSVDYNKSLFLVRKLINSLKKSKNLKIILKEHPTYNFNIKDLELTKLPVNFVVTNKSVEFLLNEIDLVLNIDSTIGLEALKKHIPVIEVGIENHINLTRMDYCEELKIVAHNEVEIRNKIIEVLNWNRSEKENYFFKTDKFLSKCFNAPTDTHILKMSEF